MGIISKETLRALEENAGFKKAKFHDYWVHPTDDSVFHIVKSPRDESQFELRALNVSVKTAKYGIMGKRVCKPLYKTFRDLGKHHALHVLKGLAFLDFDKVAHLLPENFTYQDLRDNAIVINHKDGDRFNNHVDNLEWITQRENVQHSIIIGMRSDCLTGWYYDVIKDKEEPFFSFGTLGKKIDSSHSYISRYLKSDRTSLLNHRYMLRREHENEYPVVLTKDDCWRPCIGGIHPIKVLDTETGRVRYFSDKVSVLEHTGMSEFRKFTSHLDMIRYKHYQITPVNDYEKIMELRYHHVPRTGKGILVKPNKNMPWPVIATLPDGKEIKFNSSQEAADYFGLKKSALKARLQRANGKWRDLHFRYVKDVLSGE